MSIQITVKGPRKSGKSTVAYNIARQLIENGAKVNFSGHNMTETDMEDAFFQGSKFLKGKTFDLIEENE